MKKLTRFGLLTALFGACFLWSGGASAAESYYPAWRIIALKREAPAPRRIVEISTPIRISARARRIEIARRDLLRHRLEICARAT